MNALRVEIWSDVACPWCWLGKRNLEAAIEHFGHPVEVVWRAFELDPSAPRKPEPGVGLVERLARKYGASRAQAQAMIDRTTQKGAEAGLEFRFDRVQPGSTFDAHRLLVWAAEHSGHEVQGALKERLFQAYMYEGRLVSDHEVLVELAAEVGLPAELAQAMLASSDYERAVREEQAVARGLEVTGVPFFVIGEHHAVSGAQPTEVLLQVMMRVQAEEDATRPLDDAEACGPDGCAVPTA
ncbi:DsbA family oxidoreductase [Paraliomyxa miuraensis]|uniref:DsbA family oxidoreductase n=1 Tax=Paraliomyxa miuraensis TaxID=376150 RepID=UPI0022561DB1|nr:DsbA family oxidoreductase [Paraliomyxa miuraensis]MCX4241236.1 DsbA family oxidoreductase [Paraliomyxa miuraensis]